MRCLRRAKIDGHRDRSAEPRLSCPKANWGRPRVSKRDRSFKRDVRMRCPGGRLRRGRAVGGGDRGTPRAQGARRREGAALRRHHRAIGRLAVDSQYVAGAGLGHRRRSGAGADLSAPRGRQRLRCRARRCVPDRRARGGRFLHQQNGGTVRHAADFSGLSRRSPRRCAGRPLDGDAAVRRTRARAAHQKSRQPAAGAHRVRHDARLRQGDPSISCA